MIHNRLLLIIAIAVSLVGCHVPGKVREVQSGFRHALLEMETNQIMDNLIRAKNGLPFVHVDYGTIQGTVTDTIDGNLGGIYTFPGVAMSSLIAGQDQKQLGVIGNPVRDDPGVYTAYLEFLALKDSLHSSPCPPPAGAAHICRCSNGNYYWVPVERRGEFFDMAMRITGLRSQALVAKPYFELTVTSVGVDAPKSPDDIENKMPVSSAVSITFEEELKGDSGEIELSVAGKVVRIPVALPKKKLGKSTSQMLIKYKYSNKKRDIADGAFDVHPFDLKEALTGRRVKFFADRYRPEASTSDKILKQIELQLNSIRLAQ